MIANVVDLPTRSDRRMIEVEAGELSSLVAQAEKALIATNAGIYQRGGQLVRIATLERDTAQHGVRRAAGSTVIVPVTRDYLPLALGRAADWQRYDGRTKKMQRINPPRSIASTRVSCSRNRLAARRSMSTCPRRGRP